MSEKYKTHENGLYFVSFSVVGWIDVFTRRNYQDILVDSIIYCQNKKELQLFCYCLMPSHAHLIRYSADGSISNVLRDLNLIQQMKLLKLSRITYKKAGKNGCYAYLNILEALARKTKLCNFGNTTTIHFTYLVIP